MRKLLFLFTFAVVAFAANNCVYNTVGTAMALTADCTTDAPIIIPNGFTQDGQGYKITAVDPSGDHFRGGVLQNGGSLANVINTVIETVGLANVCDAGADRLRGILFDGASGTIAGNTILAVNQNPSPGVLSGCQEGNGIEARNFGSFAGRIQVAIDSNQVFNYQKTGIIVNGAADGTVTNNVVQAAGPNPYIAQNGIQFGFGGSGSAKRNTVSANSYSGTSAVSGGVLVVGGPFYGGDYSKGIQIVGNTLVDNDVGAFLSNIDGFGNAPAVATNNKVTNNVISDSAVTNGYVYQAGISDVGNNDKMISNTISGAGYDPTNSCNCLFKIDADTIFTNKPKVQANK